MSNSMPKHYTYDLVLNSPITMTSLCDNVELHAIAQNAVNRKYKS